MSIIYDALQKTQKIQTAEETIQKKSNKRPLRTIVLLLATMIVFIIFISTDPSLIKWSHRQPAPLVSNTKLNLNGVFLSDDTKVAMINNHLFHVGNTVNNMRIVSIDYEGVKLANGKNIIFLQQS